MHCASSTPTSRSCASSTTCPAPRTPAAPTFATSRPALVRGRVLLFSSLDNLHQRRLRRGGAELQPDVWLRGNDGAAVMSEPFAIPQSSRSHPRFRIYLPTPPPCRFPSLKASAWPASTAASSATRRGTTGAGRLRLPAVAAGVYTQEPGLRGAGGARSRANAQRPASAPWRSTRATPTPAPASAACATPSRWPRWLPSTASAGAKQAWCFRPASSASILPLEKIAAGI